MAMNDHSLYLLDVNVMLALSLTNHSHHIVATRWFENVDLWATCPLTESSYCRLLMNAKVTGFELSAAEVFEALRSFCSVSGHVFLADTVSMTAPIINLGGIVGYRQVTDFHLVNLAASSEAVLATLDARIPAMLSENDRRYVEVIPID
jgi:hypothetical protein